MPLSISQIDLFVLFGTLAFIVLFGIWKSRQNDTIDAYFKGGNSMRWGTIGLSVMATQASAITFLSTTGYGWESGMQFVQNYFGLPIALIVVSTVFIPLYYKLKVYTAYEFLEKRFDLKTRLLGAFLFLIQRGLAAGITIYAPAIILSTILGWNLTATILLVGILVVLYTVSGGSKAVGITQKHQMAVIMGGMVIAFIYIIKGLPQNVDFTDALYIGGSLGKLEAVDFTFDLSDRYNVWTGLLGGTFLALSYFGTDQSQVARYLTGTNVTQSRLGMMVNAILKIPMQFFILLCGVMLFVFYLFGQQPIYFKPTAENLIKEKASKELVLKHEDLLQEWNQNQIERKEAAQSWLAVKGNTTESDTKLAAFKEKQAESEAIRTSYKNLLNEIDEDFETKDSDYVFLTFILTYLPTGLIGLLLAVIFSAAMSSTASELNALGSTTFVDFYKRLIKNEASDRHFVIASKISTLFWGAIAISFAIYAHLLENLIEAVNILGSIFYGVVLGIFLIAFFFKKIQGSATFWAAVISQIAVIVMFLSEVNIGYLWYNMIGCVFCIGLAFIFSFFEKPTTPSLGVE